MRKLFTIAAMLLAGSLFAQTENVGIGTKNPDESAILDLSSNQKGFLLPRMSSKQRLNIVKPAQGLQVYQTDEKFGLYIFNGSDWTNAANSVMAATDPWLRGGNSILSGEFIGTTNAESLRFKANNQKAGLIDIVGGNTFFGLYAGNVINTAVGFENVGVGDAALLSNTDGRSNLAIGSSAMRLNTIGNFNTVIGKNALRSNLISGENVAIGSNALQNSVGNGFIGENVAIGGNAMFSNTTGTSNIGIGPGALYSNLTGIGNFALGVAALGAKTSGNNNITIGNFAGQNNISGSNNVFIGYLAGRNETSSDKIYIASSATTTPLIYGDMVADFIAIGGVDANSAKRDNLASNYGLLVRKGILTEKIKVATMTSTDWADYVFDKNYKIMSLEDVDSYIKTNKHLPNVPTTKEMMSNGNDLMKTDAKLLEKIEELTLYMIDINKQVKELQKENKGLKSKLK